MTKDKAGIMYPTSVRFEPAVASSPRLSLDFLPVDLSYLGFILADSHLGLVLLRQPILDGGPNFLVCDPFFAPAILSRATGRRFEFDAVCATVDAERPRAWVASFRDSGCSWRALPRSGEVWINFDPYWLEQRCVHAAGSVYWHICGCQHALALDAATMAFSLMRVPDFIWEDLGHPKYRVGETPDGRLCVATVEHKALRLCVRALQGTGSSDGWVMERELCLRNALNAVPGLAEHPLRESEFSYWISDVDPGRTGRVFIRTLGCGRFSCHMDTGKLESLLTDDGMEYGDPILAYFAVPNEGSD
ncbi:unnamed protein product [Urochloa decumbens]|uniref:DUF1618 domain-containing protein n=1 Tax=Urochloa decumbens TaxID=240449 RepID=A0ABC9FHB5_9POAL